MVGRAGGRTRPLTSGRNCHINWLVSRIILQLSGERWYMLLSVGSPLCAVSSQIVDNVFCDL
jgi:hypothetical protein